MRCSWSDSNRRKTDKEGLEEHGIFQGENGQVFFKLENFSGMDRLPRIFDVDNSVPPFDRASPACFSYLRQEEKRPPKLMIEKEGIGQKKEFCFLSFQVLCSL